jgi:branched-chain amino acid transport system permease protein
VTGHAERLQLIGRQLWTPLALSALVVGVAELVTLGGATLERIAVMMVINLIIVVGLYAFVGISGVFSFGQVSFMAIGAYTTGILSIPTGTKDVIFTSMPAALRHAHVGSVAAILAGGVVAALVAVVFALPLSRLSGLVAGLGTFAFLLIVNVVASAWTAVTNGTTGMSAIPVSTTLTRTLIFAIAAILVAFAYQSSRFGRRLRTSREDEVAARAVGVNVGFERGLGFVVSALIVGMAGGLYATYLGNIDPSAFFLNITFLTIAMLVVGGMTSLSGAVIGTIFISVVAELLRRVEAGFHVGGTFVHAPAGLQEVGLGLLMLGVLIWHPQGLTSGRELTFPARRGRFTARGKAEGETAAKPEEPMTPEHVR